MSNSFNVNEINKRFFSLFSGKKKMEIAALLGVGSSAISEWSAGKKQVPWDKLAIAKELSGRSWDWLLAGMGEVANPALSKKKKSDSVDTMNGEDIQAEGDDMDEKQRRRGLEALHEPASAPGNAYPDPLNELNEVEAFESMVSAGNPAGDYDPPMLELFEKIALVQEMFVDIGYFATLMPDVMQQQLPACRALLREASRLHELLKAAGKDRGYKPVRIDDTGTND
jgi:DNA-binding transcriptional regulator YdaS (Cro superfamily)